MAGSISIRSLLVPHKKSFLENKNNGSCLKLRNGKRRTSRKCRAVVSQTWQGPSAAYAKDMERLAAKESLLLALFRSPYLEGQWKFEWFGSEGPGLLAAQIVFERFPAELANLSRLDVRIKDGYAKITANLNFLNSVLNFLHPKWFGPFLLNFLHPKWFGPFLLVQSRFIFCVCITSIPGQSDSKLSVEGPLRMSEEYIEGIFESPKIKKESIPQQLKGAFDQANSTVQQLPVSTRDAAMSGFKVPLDEI